MQKLERKGKILVFIGIILVVIGIGVMFWAVSVSGFNAITRSGIGFSLIFLPIVVGLVFVILPIIKKKRKIRSDFEKEEDPTSLHQIKDFQKNNKSAAIDSEQNRKCNVCETIIPGGKNVCPSCGDTYS
ncbi:MAG TPA: hypothetical protein VMW55_02915 [Nitrosopumilaceae archaeon]|jgi:Na+-transporting methylmalonyl-CoA/oxaloacetate decarboxylase gamma subunit|nr:hypothetical protein [Nitrosopumilaceae archaeon]